MKARPESALHFAEKLKSLRMSAMIIYDRGKQLGQSQEELGKSVEPLMQVLKRMVEDAVEHDFAGVCEAVKEIQSEIRIHEHDRARIEEKADTARHHVVQLMNAIKISMVAKGTDQRMDRGYCATLVKLGDKEELTIR